MYNCKKKTRDSIYLLWVVLNLRHLNTIPIILTRGVKGVSFILYS